MNLNEGAVAWVIVARYMVVTALSAGLRSEFIIIDGAFDQIVRNALIVQIWVAAGQECAQSDDKANSKHTCK